MHTERTGCPRGRAWARVTGRGRRGSLGLAFAILATGGAALPLGQVHGQPVFVDVTTEANITFVHNLEDDADHIRKMNTGSAVGDYDGDGWDDIYVCNGYGFANHLYHNDGDGTFSEVAGSVGADLTLVMRESKGALFLDYDGDGWVDLFILNDADAYDSATESPPATVQPNLYRNLGDGTFEDVTVSAGIPSQTYENIWGLESNTVAGGVVAGDLNGDGYLEIFISYWQHRDVLLLNNGDGTFTDISTSAGIDTFNKDSWAPLMFDFNNDGLLDIHVNTDFTENQLFINQGDMTFVDQAADAGLDIAMWNEMGATLGDYDNDGDFDLYMTNVEQPAGVVGTEKPAEHWNRFMRNDTVGSVMSFTDIGGESVEVVRTGWGWGVTFFDYDNDGWQDLGVVNGQPSDGSPVFFTDPSRMFRNNGDGSFTDVSEETGFNDTRIARSLIAFDYDHDGDRDLFVTNYLESALLFRNDGGDVAGNWIVIDPVGTPPNTRGIGAVVHVEAGGISQMRLISAGTSYISQEPDEAHFGLGDATVIDSITVVWPDGTVDVAIDVGVNQRVDFIQGVGLPSANGACCFGDDLCVDFVDGPICTLIGGGFLGDALMCDGDEDDDGVIGCADLCPNTPPDMTVDQDGCMSGGACCFVDLDICLDDVEGEVCRAIDGTFQGLGSMCDGGCSIVPGDFDGNLIVDLDDFAVFQSCLTGPGGGPIEPGCELGDFDFDGDIDLLDFAGFQRVFGLSAVSVLESLLVSPSSLDLEIGQLQQLTVTGVFDDGSQMDLTNDPDTEYESDNEVVATVGSDGEVTAITEGDATITVSRADGDVTPVDVPVTVVTSSVTADPTVQDNAGCIVGLPSDNIPPGANGPAELNVTSVILLANAEGGVGPLTFDWIADDGSYDNPNVENPVWNVPFVDSDTLVTFTVTVTDEGSGMELPFDVQWEVSPAAELTEILPDPLEVDLDGAPDVELIVTFVRDLDTGDDPMTFRILEEPGLPGQVVIGEECNGVPAFDDPSEDCSFTFDTAGDYGFEIQIKDNCGEQDLILPQPKTSYRFTITVNP